MSEKLYPIIYNGEKYYEKDCDETFTCFYTCKEALNPEGGVYAYDGMIVYPDGTIEY